MIIIQTSCVLKHPETYQSSQLFRVLLLWYHPRLPWNSCPAVGGICWVYFITSTERISEAKCCIIFIAVLILLFVTDLRYMLPNLGPSTMAHFCALFSTLPTSHNFILLLHLLFTTWRVCEGFPVRFNAVAYQTWEGKTSNWQTAFYLFKTEI